MTIDTSKVAPATRDPARARWVGSPLGIERCEILAGTRPEWTPADLGALCAGATVVPIYQTNSPEEYILAHAAMATTPRACAGRTSRAA